MATLDELQQQLNALQQKVDSITAPPTDYYTQRYSGEETDRGVEIALGLDPDGTGIVTPEHGGTGADTTQAALAALGAGVRPRLGINMDFRINQRGQSNYKASGRTYTVDGWYLATTGGTVTVNSDGTITIGAANSTLWQLIPPNEFTIGKPFTFSVFTPTGELYSITVNELGTSTDQRENTDFGYLRVQYYNGNVGVNITPTKETTLLCAKPEEGPNQTLAYQDSDGKWKLLPQSDSGYGTQLVECQRYLIPMQNSEERISRATSSIVRAWFPTPAPMRTDPVLISGSFQVKTLASGNVMTNAVWSYKVEGCGVMVTATLAAHGQTDGTIYSNNAILSAQL